MKKNINIKIGTRGSRLALWQANWVKTALTSINPCLFVDIIIIKTKGDKILDVPLAMVGGKGLFVKEIEEALLDRRIDLAVHSMKDMPAEIPNGLCIGAVPERETPNDVLISKNGVFFSDLINGSKIGTSSLRRSAQLLHVRPDIVILPLRGNLDTRLKKLEAENMDAIILAAAGVKRLNFESRITEYLNENIMLPAVGQGALCIEIRENDAEIEPIVATLDHQKTRLAIMGERAFSNRLEGGCQVPIAAYGKIAQNLFTMNGLVADIDGKIILKKTMSGPVEQAESIGVKLADSLLSMGAKTILENIKTEINENYER